MSEIKTVDERLSGIDFSGNRVEVSTEEFAALNDEVSELRAAYEALQKDLAQAKEEIQNYENSCRIVQAWNGQMTLANGELRVANAAQAKRIAELEKDLVEWNEFKKIRDMQMQALRKQMS